MKSLRCVGWFGVFAVVAFVATAPHARADVTGTILGTVADPTGAVVVTATVTLHNPNTGLTRSTATDNSGIYQFLLVPIGEGYTVEVNAAGFQKASQTAITLQVNQSFRADFRLQVGAAAQSVEVSAAVMQVETTSTQLGDVIDDKKMTTLPLNGRSYLDLLGLQPGVVPVTSGASFSNHSASGDLFSGILSVNGMRESGNAFLVNGGDVEESTNNGASIVPTLDSIQEFRLLTNSFDAEYGRFTGAIVNVVTKSGTNSVHGTAYEFLRNNVLDARNFFDQNQVNPSTGQQIPNSAKGTFKQNQFGGGVGAPILKNRLFTYTDYQGTRQIMSTTSSLTAVPSLGERGGDFSDVATTGFPALTGVVRGDNTPNSGSMNEVLTQRLGYGVNNGEPYWVPGCTTMQAALDGICVFPNQVIPQKAMSPAALGTLKFIPDPSGYRNGQPYYSTSAYPGTVRDDKWAERIDLHTERSGDWAFYYHFDDAAVFNPFAGGNVPGFPSDTPTRAQQANASNIKTFGPSMVNEFRVNYTRNALRLGEASGAGLGSVTSFGFDEGGLGLIPSVKSLEGVPQISLNSTGVSFGVPSSTFQFDNTYQLADNVSKILGSHTIKFGGDIRKFQINMRWLYNMNGTYGFSGTETGNDFADYLLGAPDLFIQASPGNLDARSTYLGLYIQDSYKIKPNLTINYGLRWEFSRPWSDEYNRLQAFVPGEQSKLYPNAPEGWVVAGDPGIPPTLGPTRYKNFDPRLGIAYSPGFREGLLGKLFGGPGKTSIRAAGGIYTTAFEQIQNNFELGNPPFAQYWQSPTFVYLEEPFKGRNAPDPGQRFPFVQPPVGEATNWSVFQPVQSVPGFVTDNKLPYAEHFNFTIQRDVEHLAIFTIGYVGTIGHHLLGEVAANPGNEQLCLDIPGCGPFGENTIYNANGKTYYGTRPYGVTSGRYLSQGILDFGDVTWMTTWDNSAYNALEVSANRSIGALRLLAAFTWSKSIDDGSGFADSILNPYNHALSRGLSAFDMPYNFVVSYAYDLPFAKWLGRHRLVDGWQLSGITRFSSGFPVLLADSADPSLCGCGGGGADFPDYNGQPITFYNPRSSNDHLYFSTGNFSDPALGTIGTANRRFFIGPGLNNTDVALHKTTRITERMEIEFRAEFFNAFNHAQFMNPVGDINSSDFGLVEAARAPRIGQLALKLKF
jgi:hypothetical protein